MTGIQIVSAAPMTTVQDAGRPGMLRHGVAASGPLDRAAYRQAAEALGRAAPTCIEFGTGRLMFRVTGGKAKAAFCGGSFELKINEVTREWGRAFELSDGDEIAVTPGRWGNFGLVRFDQLIDVPQVLGSRSTNLIAGLGGFEGRCLTAGDSLRLIDSDVVQIDNTPSSQAETLDDTIRVIWGIHADLFSSRTREAALDQVFTVSPKLDRMGMRLEESSGVFADRTHLSLVSDVVVPGDIQILGDGTPIVLMRDHQPTGGYPRVATIIGPDIDRLVQMRPGSEVRFTSVTVEKAHAIAQARG